MYNITFFIVFLVNINLQNFTNHFSLCENSMSKNQARAALQPGTN